jgi:hypothetical protein
MEGCLPATTAALLTAHAAKVPVPAHPAPSIWRQVFALPPARANTATDRAGVDAEIHSDRRQRRGAGAIRRCHGRPPVAICPGKRLERLERWRSLRLRHGVEALGSPQPPLHAGHDVLTTQVHLVLPPSLEAGIALPGMHKLCIPGTHGCKTWPYATGSVVRLTSVSVPHLTAFPRLMAAVGTVAFRKSWRLDNFIGLPGFLNSLVTGLLDFG